jgi:transcription elongation factor Elf1
MKCPRCNTRQLVVIDLEVGGEQLSLHSCSACDVRWWQGRDGRLPVNGVLHLAGRR